MGKQYQTATARLECYVARPFAESLYQGRPLWHLQRRGLVDELLSQYKSPPRNAGDGSIRTSLKLDLIV